MPRHFVLALLLALGPVSGCALGDDGLNPRNRDGAVADGASASDAAMPTDGGRTGDAGSRCIEGAPLPCNTACGSMGTALCVRGAPGACAAPAETCDGVDEDCDGLADEGVAPRTCTTECGGGTSQCAGGRFTACTGGTPRGETCDGTDEDCDGAIDEDLTRACTTACGAGNETCTGGAFGGCTAPAPRVETCDGVDEDCDADVDEDLTRGCTTACGTGVETCAAGSFAGCTAPAPAAELCDRADQDCDGRVDEGFQASVFDAVPMADLTLAQPPCTGPNAGLDVCMSAARRWCLAHAWGCFPAGGAGHLTATATNARVVCFGERADEHNATYAAVSSASGITVDVSNVYTRVAQSAVNRYCQTRGMAAGVGPSEHDVELTVTCLPAGVAETVSIATSELTARGCNPISNPNTLACSTAADAVCVARGRRAGYGPVEWNTMDAAVVCFLAG